MTIDLHPAVREDLDYAFDYYETKRPGLGVEFVTEFRAGIEKILSFPNAWRPLDKTYRQYRLRRFPYGIVYSILPDKQIVRVFAVTDLRRNPRWWRDRT